MSRLSYLARSTILGSFAFALNISAASATELNPNELLSLSLEQLSNIEVTSVSKRSEKASEAAAAIFVITPEDIKRSGATSIPEALRMVPGLNVAQSGSHQWAVSSRGSNDQFSNKLLVLMDGRTIYTPLFSGVYWDVQDTPLQDIERIEVIRGPGATLWGANAVNGVINIITKKAEDTQGGLASLTLGSFKNAETTGRYGAKIGDKGHMRVYAKYTDNDEAKTNTGTGAGDNWNKIQTGFRADMDAGEKKSYTIQGDIYSVSESYALNLPTDGAARSLSDRETARGANILGRWKNKLSDTTEFNLQMYYDDARRSNILYSSNIQTFDIDTQYATSDFSNQEIVVGAAYRFIDSSTEGTDYIKFAPPSRSDNLVSTFIQDKITLLPKEVFLTLGTKLEYNEYTDFEYEPSARLSWLINENHTLWSSISRAVRTPNVGQSDLQLSAATLAAGVIGVRYGDPHTESEEVVTYEIGYRIQPTDNTSLDIATFYNDYDKLVLGMQGTPFGPITTSLGTYVVVPVLPVNMGTASSYGFETVAKWNATSYAEFTATYSYLQLKFDQPDPFGFSFAGKSPINQINFRSSFQLPNDVQFDTSLYFVDNLDRLAIPQYTRLDTRLAWQALDSLELSIVGQNLLDNRHKEFTGFLYQSQSQIPRSVYGNITWKF
jgi:iron complex outermembrane receptor protein